MVLFLNISSSSQISEEFSPEEFLPEDFKVPNPPLKMTLPIHIRAQIELIASMVRKGVAS